MTAVIPSLDEINATIARMAARFDAMQTDDARRVMTAYHRLSDQFGAGLADPRDVALSRGAALMMVQELLLARRH
jgi:hypothetical protein